MYSSQTIYLKLIVQLCVLNLEDILTLIVDGKTITNEEYDNTDYMFYFSVGVFMPIFLLLFSNILIPLRLIMFNNNLNNCKLYKIQFQNEMVVGHILFEING